MQKEKPYTGGQIGTPEVIKAHRAVPQKNLRPHHSGSGGYWFVGKMCAVIKKYPIYCKSSWDPQIQMSLKSVSHLINFFFQEKAVSLYGIFFFLFTTQCS